MTFINKLTSRFELISQPLLFHREIFNMMLVILYTSVFCTKGNWNIPGIGTKFPVQVDCIS